MQHTDLHPGNILVRVRPAAAAGAKGAAEQEPLAPHDILMKPIRRGQARAQLQLVRRTLHFHRSLLPFGPWLFERQQTWPPLIRTRDDALHKEVKSTFAGCRR